MPFSYIVSLTYLFSIITIMKMVNEDEIVACGYRKIDQGLFKVRFWYVSVNITIWINIIASIFF
jgi:hypothetical protein